MVNMHGSNFGERSQTLEIVRPDEFRCEMRLIFCYTSFSVFNSDWAILTNPSAPGLFMRLCDQKGNELLARLL